MSYATISFSYDIHHVSFNGNYYMIGFYFFIEIFIEPTQSVMGNETESMSPR